MWTRWVQVCAMGLVWVGRAEAADGSDPALALEFEIAAGLAAEVFTVDPLLADLLRFNPLSLPPLAQEYEVVDLEDYTDPTSATIRLTTGALLLRDPSETGTLARFRFKGADGNWVRDSEGRYYMATWYELDDGRLAKVIRNADGDGVGTYTVDPGTGGYELALDLDADRVIDVHDALTPDGHEQISATRFGREWIELFSSGYNALCYPAVAGGLAGMPDFGRGADARAEVGGCNLSRGERAGGFAGSLGQPSDEGTPIDALCDAVGGPGESAAISDLRERLAGSRKADECSQDCMTSLTICVGICGAAIAVAPPPVDVAPVLVCLAGCTVIAIHCDYVCEREASESGENPAPVPQESSPVTSSPAGPYYDTDGDGAVDSEDTDEDGVPDLACSTTGCGSTALPDPETGAGGGADWDAFCRHEKGQPDTWGDIEDGAADCPELDESARAKATDFSSWFEVCFAPPKDQDLGELLRDTSGGCGLEEGRGCEPKTVAELRARFMQSNESTLGFVLDCGDDLLCQPPVP